MITITIYIDITVLLKQYEIKFANFRKTDFLNSLFNPNVSLFCPKMINIKFESDKATKYTVCSTVKLSTIQFHRFSLSSYEAEQCNSAWLTGLTNLFPQISRTSVYTTELKMRFLQILYEPHSSLTTLVISRRCFGYSFVEPTIQRFRSLFGLLNKNIVAHFFSCSYNCVFHIYARSRSFSTSFFWEKNC